MGVLKIMMMITIGWFENSW